MIRAQHAINAHVVEKRKKTVEKLEELIHEVETRIQSYRTRRYRFKDYYDYIVLEKLLRDVYQHVKSGRKVNTRSTYILPGALWIVKALLHNKLTVDDAANYICRIRYLARKMFRTLVYDKNLTLIIPSNLSVKDVKVYLWADKVGYDRDGNPLYVLTMYFSFPFDINELDKRSEYEPVSFLFVKKEGKYVPLKAYARVHYDLYVYDIERLQNVKILFMRMGHTPKILSSNITRISRNNIVKEILDKAWIIIGDFLTRITGTEEINIKKNPSDIHVYVKYKLPRTINNPFTTSINPYFIDVTIM